MQHPFCKYLLSLLLSCSTLAMSQAADGVEAFLRAPGLSAASVGYCLIDAETGQPVEAYGDTRALVPASVLKTVTTAAALELLGPGHTFATRAGYTGRIDAGGVLHGDIVVRGGGDPMLGSTFSRHPGDAFLKQLLAAVRRAGIRSVAGRILCDDTLFDTEGISPKWLWEDLGNYYAAGSYALNYADNLYRLTLRSGAAGTTPVILGTTPEIPGLEFVNCLKASPSSADSVYIYGAPYSLQRTLYGTLPAHRQTFAVKGDIPDPPLYLGQAATAMLRSGGIAVSGPPATVRQLRQAGEEEPAGTPVPLLTFLSDPLTHIVAQTNKHSNNLFAETLLRQLALTVSPTASSTRGLEVLMHHWKERGVDTSSMMLCDGSGLSPVNGISARTLADILLKTYRGAHGETFLHTLPQAGKEGTVKNLLAAAPLSGQLYLKSGSMTRVQCYAGYYIGQKPYVVVLLINNFTGTRAQLKKQIEQLLLSRLSGR